MGVLPALGAKLKVPAVRMAWSVTGHSSSVSPVVAYSAVEQVPAGTSRMTLFRSCVAEVRPSLPALGLEELTLLLCSVWLVPSNA